MTIRYADIGDHTFSIHTVQYLWIWLQLPSSLTYYDEIWCDPIVHHTVFVSQISEFYLWQ